MVQAVLERLDTAPLDVFVVWTPAVSGDDYQAALGSMSLISDPRARHYWDGSQALGEALAPVLGIRARMAWDVFVAFGGNARWEGVPPSPPAPEDWLHQLAGEAEERELTGEKLEGILRELVPQDGRERRDGVERSGSDLRLEPGGPGIGLAPAKVRGAR